MEDESKIKKSGSKGKITTIAAKARNKFWGSPKPTNVYIYIYIYILDMRIRCRTDHIYYELVVFHIYKLLRNVFA